MSSVYHINKGVSKPIVFKGLKAQYIAYLAIGLVLLLLVFVLGYILGMPLYLLLGLVLGLGALLFYGVFRLSFRFGEHGLMKFFARRGLPGVIVFRSRHLFTALKSGTRGLGLVFLALMVFVYGGF
ncbi:uncharacterized protein (DUF58 family) [Pedobacter cryoconitis]|uniref:DUF4133 domain-containing protein n=1 Tax=Pedobacter cryoconitis TaxID=188932 RepID=UPI0016093D1E|nr:DUF4133 domain-containing protein [Pedobacter cryoconitis]MBB6271859.1 uncharacterized protein (DUF58 family) [Pedobacter cryoconitis]